jgi:A/G-specific adenine glycosylase
MLQQTQTKRVLEYYPRFLLKFPSFSVLARASLAEVLQAWQGLGYNRRGKNLWLLAQAVEERFSGQLPTDTPSLLSLPGVGTYTAAALQTFIFGIPVPMIETNIRAVYLAEFFEKRRVVSDAEILPLIEKTLHKKDPRLWFYALMDYGVHLKGIRPGLNKKSRHFRPQSKFEGSVRQVRGAVLRTVLELSKVSAEDLAARLGKSLKDIEAPLKALLSEGLIERKGSLLRVPKNSLTTKSLDPLSRSLSLKNPSEVPTRV